VTHNTLGQLMAATALLLLAGCGDGPGRARHVVIVSVDTLRADRLGAYGYARARTPAIDALAAESVRFERAYAHSSMTLPSVASLLTGHAPGRHGVLSNMMSLGEGSDTLATRLRAAGFRTGGFVGNPVLRREAGIAEGFEHYAESFRVDGELVKAPEHSAALLTSAALGWLDSLDPGSRVFLWLHYQEPHGPYQPQHFEAPEPSEDEIELPQNSSHSGRGGIPRYQWLGHGRLSEYQARYDAEIAELDQELSRLLLGLRQRGLLEQSALVFTADHGEAFGEEGVFCAHGEGLGETLLHVPLLLRVAGEAAALRRDRVGLADVAPTMLRLAGVSSSASSLTEDLGDRTIVAQMLGEVGDWNSWRSIRSGSRELSEREPRPGKTAPEPLPELRELRTALDAVAPWLGDGRPDALELGPREREALRNLGYLER